MLYHYIVGSNKVKHIYVCNAVKFDCSLEGL